MMNGTRNNENAMSDFVRFEFVIALGCTVIAILYSSGFVLPAVVWLVFGLIDHYNETDQRPY